MAKSEEPEIEDSLEAKLIRLAEINTELKMKKKEYLNSIKHLRDMKKSYETVITGEVLKMAKSISVGNIRAEYVPQVRFQMKKETEND